MEETHPHIPVKADAPSIACLAVAIAVSALAFSMSASSFLHVKETVLAILLVPFAILNISRRDRTLQGVQQFLPLIILALIPFAFSILPSFPRVPAIMHREQARLVVLILYAVIAFDLLREERNRRHITNAFLATAAASALFAYVQRFGPAPWLFPVFEGSADPLYSTFGNSGLLGGYLAMAVPFAIHRALTSPKVFAPIFMLITIAPALALSGSRASWLAAAIGTLVIIPYRTTSPKRIIVTTFVIAATAAATFIIFSETRPTHWLDGGKQDTIRLRLWFWDGAIRMTAANPIIGVGPGNFQYWSPKFQGDALQSNYPHISNEAHTRYAHNEPLHLAAETGIIGIALCAWMLIRLLRCKGPEWGGLAAALTFGLFHFPLHSAPHAVMIALFAAMLLARGERVRVRGRSLGGINRAHVNKPSIAIATVSLSLLLAAITTYDVLLPSIALRHADDLQAQGKSANQAYKKAINTGRYHPQAHANYANVLLQQGDLEAAKRQLKLALKGQDTGDLHLALGYIALQQGDMPLAQKHLLAATHRWPKNQTARGYLQQTQPSN